MKHMYLHIAWIAPILLFSVGVAAYNLSGPIGDIQESGLPLSGGTMSGDISLNDDVDIAFGTGQDASMVYNATQGPDSLFIGVGTDSRVLLIGEEADKAVDWGKAQQTNPNLCVASADSGTTTDLVCVYHNQTDGYIVTDGGELIFDSAGNVVRSADPFLAASTLFGRDTIAIGSDDNYMWSDNVAGDTGNYDTMMGRGAAGRVRFGNGSTVGGAVDVPGAANSKGQTMLITSATEVLTFAGNPGDATKVTSGLIPSGALLLGVSSRITTSDNGGACTALGIGDGADPNMFGDSADAEAGTVTDSDDYTAAWTIPKVAATEITVTGTGGNCFDTVVRITAHYITTGGPTSN